MTKEKTKSSLSQKLVARYTQSARTGMILLRGQSNVTVYGCRKILLYSPEQIHLQSGKRIVMINGKRLLCSSFSGGAVSVKGIILGVAFEGLAEKEELNRK